jgi:hypothetical protein
MKGIRVWCGRLWMTLAACAVGVPALATDSQVDLQMGSVQSVKNTEYGIGNGSVVVAPIPFSNPTIGSGLALGGGYLFQLDEGSDTSNFGAGGMRSDNGSEAYGALLSLSWDDNRWTLSAFAGLADVRYDLFLAGLPVPLQQSGSLARATFGYGLTEDLSVGLGLQYLDTSIAPDIGLALPESLESVAALEVLNTSLIADWDRRDDDIYATRGYRIYGEAARGFVLDGLIRNFTKLTTTLDGYRPLGDRGVVAARLASRHRPDRRPRAETGRIRPDPRDHRARTDLHRAGHLLGDVERALFLQVLEEMAAHPAHRPARR